MTQITDGQWALFAKEINNFSDNTNKEVVSWGTKAWGVDEFGEDNKNVFTYVDLEALVGYNTFRTWPITKHTDAGELDNQNMVLYLNRKYLADQGWLTAKGYFNFKPEEDRFIHRGILYKCDGDTLASPAKDDPLMVMVILVRQEIQTGSDLHGL